MTAVKRIARSPFAIVTLSALFWFCLAFLVLPTSSILGSTFINEGQLTLRSFGRLLASDRAMASLRNSFMLAITLPIATTVVGVFIVLVTRYFEIRGSKILFLGYATPLIYGGVALVAGYKFIYGGNGVVTKFVHELFPFIPLDWFHGYPAVIFIMTLGVTGDYLLFLTPALAKVDHNTIEAAEMMGASQWKVLRTIVLPTLSPMLFALTILKFLAGLGAMAAPLIVGGQEFQTISPMVLTFAQSPSSRDLAATLGLILGLATMVLIFGLNFLEKRGSYISVSKVPATLQRHRLKSPFANVAVHVCAWGLWVLYVLPPAFVVLFSFADAPSIVTGTLTWNSFTLDNYKTVFTDAASIRPFLVSVVYSGLAAVGTVFITLLAARMVQKYHNWLTTLLEYLLQIPWVLPNILMALGLLLAFSEPQWLIGGQVLGGTLWLMLFGYLIVSIPFTFRLLRAAFAGIPPSLEEAAQMMGASQGRILRTVLLPLVLPATAGVFALNFNGHLNDYDISAFLSNPLFQPLGIFIRSATSGETRGDTTALVFVYTVMLMIISTTVMYFVYGRGGKELDGTGTNRARKKHSWRNGREVTKDNNHRIGTENEHGSDASTEEVFTEEEVVLAGIHAGDQE